MGRTTEELLKAREKNVPIGAFNIHPIFAQEARGAMITSVDGKEYIDFCSGIGTLNAGHCPPKIMKAISAQLEKVIHTCFHVVMYEPYIELAEKLNAITPGTFPKKTMLSNSGSEAVENGVKISRYYSKRSGVVAFEQGFHGRTLLTMTLTSKVKPYKFGFGPFAPEVYRMPYPYCYRCRFGLTYPECDLACASHLENFFISNEAAEEIACVVIEPVTGEGGFIVPPKDYMTRLHEICKTHGIILIMDEVQSGIGRTGKYYACEHFNVEPEIVLSAKSLAAGMPLSAITGKAEIMDSIHVGGLGGTYGGNPLSCASALAVLEMVEEEQLLERSTSIGQVIRKAFEEWQTHYNIIGDVRGLGAMMAVELVRDRKTKEPADSETKGVVEACRNDGLLTLSCGNFGNVMRILSPLVITDEQLDKGLSILEGAIKKADAGLS